MSSPSWLHSPILSCNDLMNNFDVESVLGNSNPFLSTQDPFLSSYNSDDHAQIFNFVDACNSGILARLSNPPVLPAFCNSSSPSDGQSWNRLPVVAAVDKKNHKMIERQRRKEMKTLCSTLRSLRPEENLRGKRAVSSGLQIWTNSLQHEIVYSEILLALEQGGLEVVSAASSTINNRVYHTIHTKVFEHNIFNVETLYHKLWHLIRTK